MLEVKSCIFDETLTFAFETESSESKVQTISLAEIHVVYEEVTSFKAQPEPGRKLVPTIRKATGAPEGITFGRTLSTVTCD